MAKDKFSRRAAQQFEKVTRLIFYNLVFPYIYPNKPLEEKIDIHSVKKILIYRPDAIGDMICITPMFSVLKKMNSAIKIIVAASDINAGIIEHDTNIFETVILTRKKKIDWKALSYLKKQKIDVLFNPIDIHTTKAGILFNKISSKGIKVGFAMDIRPYYMKLFNFLQQKPRDLKNMHISVLYIELLKGVFKNTIKDEWIEQYIVIPDKDYEKWNEFKSEKKIAKKKFIALNLSARQKYNTWEKETYEYIIRKFAEEHPSVKVVLSAVGHKDISFAKELEGHNPNVFYYETDTILESAAMCEDALLAVTPDTGFVHMCAAVKCPVATTIIDTETPWAPYNVPSRILTAPRNFIHKITPPRILAATEELMAEISR